MTALKRSELRTVGLLTGGGDCPGLNAVIRAAVKTAIRTYGFRVFGIEDGYEGILDSSKVKPLTEVEVRGILPRGGTILGTTNRGNPFQMVVKRKGKQVTVDSSQRFVRRIRELGLDALIAIGGEGSLSIARESTGSTSGVT